MAYLPPKKHEVFDRSLDGVYGHFKTKDSFNLDYLLTSVRTEKLDCLRTASEVLQLNMIDFEEIVQRDIDYMRVQRQIVDEYLKKGKGRVIFFPPLLVSLIALEDGEPIKQYSSVLSALEGAELVTTYDVNRFQVRLNTSSSETPHYVNHENQKLYYYNYAATLKYNSEKVQLVVLDGQHRLMALRKLMEGVNKEIVAGVDVPICVFFSPDARVGQAGQLLVDMRELFVRINEEAKRVSGHFIWLLKDKSLAATGVRALGDIWKSDATDGITLLHQLEWNQREDKLANQTTKPYSVTTVSIIAETLQEFIFNGSSDQKKGYTYPLLNLEEVEGALRTSPGALAPGSISDESFDPEQFETLENQIKNYLATGLDILFRTPSPYRRLRNAFVESVRNLDQQIQQSTVGAAQFKIDVLCKFRSTNDLDQPAVRDMEKNFLELFDVEEIREISFFRRNVFQQGLIRAWARMFTDLKPLMGITPQRAAEGLVAALEGLCFLSHKGLFSVSREYTQHVIYRGSKIIVNGSSKTSNRNLILATFSNGGVRTKCINALVLSGDDREVADNTLKAIGLAAAAEYLSTFQQNYIKYMRKQWRWESLDPDDNAYLAERAESSKPGKAKEFNARIVDLSEKPFEKAKAVFVNVLGIRGTEIEFSSTDHGDNDLDNEQA
jgi:DNA-sulfur modification-associated